MKKCVILILIILSINANAQTQNIMTDSRDGKIYKTTHVSNETWMAENLNFEIKNARCYNNDTCICFELGRLYTYETAIEVCPTGWHLPSLDEWEKLLDFLGGEDIAGGALKEVGYTHWNKPNTNGSDELGFTALPAGRHDMNGYIYMGNIGGWWSAREHNISKAFSISIYHDHQYVFTGIENKNDRISVRCVKD